MMEIDISLFVTTKRQGGRPCSRMEKGRKWGVSHGCGNLKKYLGGTDLVSLLERIELDLSWIIHGCPARFIFSTSNFQCSTLVCHEWFTGVPPLMEGHLLVGPSGNVNPSDSSTVRLVNCKTNKQKPWWCCLDNFSALTM